MQLGADLMMALALGDDQHDLGYDAVVDMWIENLWKILLQIYPLPNHVQALEKNTTIQSRLVNLKSILICTIKKHFIKTNF